jgi:uncharacterized phage protein gp47/JayE
MPFARDTLSTLRSKVLSDIATRLPGSDPFVRRSPLGVLGTVVAGLQDSQFGYLDWQTKEAVPVTADGEYLIGWGSLRGVALEAAAAATGTASVAGATPSSAIGDGLQLQRSDGALYTTVGSTTVAGDGTATVNVTASAAGSISNCTPGQTLSWVSPVAGLPETVTVVSLSGGTDVETNEHYRTRMLQAWANPPQGGDLADYVKWCFDNVPAVTRCWAAGPTVMGAGTVTVYFCIDDDSHTNGIPTGTNGVSQYESRDTAASGDQLAVGDAIYPLRPATALVYAAAPSGVALNITLAEVPNDATIRAGITAAVQGFLLREATPAGAQVIRRLANGSMTIETGGTLRLAHLEAAIAAVDGLDNFVMTSPAADVVLSVNGQLSTPGTITYT